MLPKEGATYVNGRGSESVQMTPAIMAERMVSAEMAERRIKRAAAECEVSVRALLAPSAITNLRKGRLDVRRLEGRIKSAFVAFLERQAGKLAHELAVARALDRECDFRAAEAALLAAQEATGRKQSSARQDYDYGAVK